MYAVNKERLFRMFNTVAGWYGLTISRMTGAARIIPSNDFDADTLVEANLDIDVMELYLIMTGSSLGA
jgi:hypothetical protein